MSGNPLFEGWYIAYHLRPPHATSPHHRVVYVDRMRFDAEGNIMPVVITRVGVPTRPLAPHATG